MVVQGVLAAALALPTGALFGIGYGTGVRIGYEQVYPLLFPKDTKVDAKDLATKMTELNRVYDITGGRSANEMGIAAGLKQAMSELDSSPDFQNLLKLESDLVKSNTIFMKSQESNTGSQGSHTDSTQSAQSEFNQTVVDTITEQNIDDFGRIYEEWKQIAKIDKMSSDQIAKKMREIEGGGTTIRKHIDQHPDSLAVKRRVMRDLESIRIEKREMERQNAPEVVLPSPTQSAEEEFHEWDARMQGLISTVQGLSKELNYSGVSYTKTPYYYLKSGKKIKSGSYARYKADLPKKIDRAKKAFYDASRTGRNSSNHFIKNQATRYYKFRF